MAEAMAFGLPVVAVDSGASPELVENEVTGLLVPPGDPAAMAEAVIRLARDPQLARRLGDAAIRRASSEFGAKRTARDTMALYLRLHAGTGG
jgi:phenylacetate-CoA ligase